MHSSISAATPLRETQSSSDFKITAKKKTSQYQTIEDQQIKIINRILAERFKEPKPEIMAEQLKTEIGKLEYTRRDRPDAVLIVFNNINYERIKIHNEEVYSAIADMALDKSLGCREHATGMIFTIFNSEIDLWSDLGSKYLKKLLIDGDEELRGDVLKRLTNTLMMDYKSLFRKIDKEQTIAMMKVVDEKLGINLHDPITGAPKPLSLGDKLAVILFRSKSKIYKDLLRAKEKESKIKEAHNGWLASRGVKSVEEKEKKIFGELESVRSKVGELLFKVLEESKDASLDIMVCKIVKSALNSSNTDSTRVVQELVISPAMHGINESPEVRHRLHLVAELINSLENSNGNHLRKD
ncbi:MAG: hypothetical protein ABR981_04625 [Candidatus Micrarchaeaceae archaeon]|jgi:hypothetical protein